MGLKDRDYMKRPENKENQVKPKRKLKELQYFQETKKNSYWKMIIISTMLLGGFFIIIEIALKIKESNL